MSPPTRIEVSFIVPYPINCAPGQRFRFEQYLASLEERGIEVAIHPFLDSATYQILYQKGHFARRVMGVLAGVFRRIRLMGSLGSATRVFIHREAAPFGPPFFEWMICSVLRKKIIYDFDDAIWTTDRQHENPILRLLKWRSKVSFICKRSFLVSCGNEYLASFAQNFNHQVRVIPTTIDTEVYLPQYQPNPKQIVIGWSGSSTTIAHFASSLPMLRELKKKFGDRVVFKVIGDGNYRDEELDITGIAWRRDNELEELATISIGIMPLPHDEWARGKCGLKGLQYMALGIPTVMSGVGVNNQIIQDGVNGFIANNQREWITKISLLVEDPILRVEMGEKGRATVEERYSVKSQLTNYLSVLTS